MSSERRRAVCGWIRAERLSKQKARWRRTAEQAVGGRKHVEEEVGGKVVVGSKAEKVEC